MVSIFGVELFVKGDTVYFSEVAAPPRHRYGDYDLQDLSEFALHARAILRLDSRCSNYGPAASYVILGEGVSDGPRFENLSEALSIPGTALRLFGKAEVRGERRLGVALALGDSLDEARHKARAAAHAVKVTL